MDVQNYIFQSPSPQRVQVGRADTSTTNEEMQTKNESFKVKEVQDLQTQKQDEQILKNTNKILDIYV